MTKDSLAVTGVAGAKYLFILAVFQRITTFLLNQLTITSVDPQVYGFYSIQLDGILLSTSLFLSREAFRLALLRSSGIDESDAKSRSQEPNHAGSAEGVYPRNKSFQYLVNISWLTIPLGTIITASISTLFFWKKQETLSGGNEAILLYASAALAELLCEPLFIIATTSLYFQLRASAETGAILSRCVVVYLFTAWYNLGIIAFALGQVAYALVLLGFYGTYFFRRIRRQSGPTHWRQLFPSRVAGSSNPWFLPEHVRLVKAFAMQSVLKHVLTEGDKILLSVVSSYAEQALYGLACHYGSLPARLLFQPIEESGRIVFSKLGSSRDSSSIMEGKSLLTLTLKFVTMIGLTFACFGSNYTSTLVYIIFKNKLQWVRLGGALSWYCLYVLFMAVNGMCEAFVFATASNAQLIHLNYRLVVFFVVYAVLAVVLMKGFNLGVAGLIMANCANMAFRIAYCTSFIHRYFAEVDIARVKTKNNTWISLRDAIPSSPVLVAFLCGWAGSYLSLVRLNSSEVPSMADYLTHIFIGTMLFLLVLLSIARTERQFLRGLKSLLQNRHRKAD